uniref:Protein YIPF n=1 Tax=Globodera rostochiensis TaxID=31243 RepID=A0A914I7T3_GLORO
MDRLEFRDFPSAGGAASADFFNSDAVNKPPPDPTILSGNLLDVSSNEPQKDEPAKPHFLSLSFYRRFFDIDEQQVFSRLLNSAMPRRTGNFIADFVQPNPDLWGPFWVCVTLVFSIAIVGNLARFLQSYGSNALFTSDFSFVTGATSLVFGYVLTLPSLVYAFLWYHRPQGLQYSFFDLLCAFGYSLAPFIPVTALWLLFPFSIARWTLAVSAVVLTGSVLVLALWPTVREDPNRLTAFGFVLAIFLAHALLALCLKVFFLDQAVPSHGAQPSSHQPLHLDVSSMLSSTTREPPNALNNNGTTTIAVVG